MAIPVSLEDAKRQLRQGGETLEGNRQIEVEGFIGDAAAWVERYTGHILVAREVTETLAGFGCMQLRAWPMKPDATIAVSFTDRAGASIDLLGSRLLVAGRPVTILPAIGTRWPPVGDGIVTVTVRAGYEPTDIVPGEIRRAMLMLISAYDMDREGGDTFAQAEKAAQSICRDLRLKRV